MTKPAITQQGEPSLTRDLIYAARYYLGRPRVLLSLATVAIVAGLVFNWSWLVAVGLAPILLSTLPCLVMCGVGVCMMCRGEKQSAPVRDAAEEAAPPAVLAVAAKDNPSAAVNQSIPMPETEETMPPRAAFGAVATEDPSAGVASCCQGQMSETISPQTRELQSNDERKESHA